MTGKTFARVIAVAAAIAAMPAVAGTQVWDMQVAATGGDSDGFGNEINLTQGSINLTITGWADDGPPNDTGIRAGKMVNYDTSGLAHWGITSRDECWTGCYPGSPDHSVDNIDNDFDFFLLEFNQDVNLTHVVQDWVWSDSDISVAAFSSNPTPFIATDPTTDSITITQLLAAAGSIYENGYANIGNQTYTAIDTEDTYAQYWLVGAYSPLIMNMGFSSNNDDGIKFSGFKTASRDNGEMPTPGSLALVLAGLLALRGRGRQKQACLKA